MINQIRTQVVKPIALIILLNLSFIAANDSYSEVFDFKNTTIEDDLERLRDIFNRNSMIVLNENTLRRPMKAFNPNQMSDDVPDELLHEYDEEVGKLGSTRRRTRHKRRIINKVQYGITTRWPNKTIPYEFDYDATDALKRRVMTATNLWESVSCVRFEEYSPVKHAHHRSKILIKNRGHCASRVGYVVDPAVKFTISEVFLPESCPIGSVIHELGHVIGFRHEHTRTDRGKHIIVHYERMQPQQRLQYEPMLNGQEGYYGIYYDLFSIMHYSNQGGLLESLDSRRSFLMGQRFTLSFSDVKMANLAYECNDNCPHKNCQNEGYMNSACQCQCPDHLTGDLCEVVKSTQPNLKSGQERKPDLNCDFEHGLCNWLQDISRDTNNWTRSSNLTELQQSYIRNRQFDFKTGPQQVDSHFIYLNSRDQTYFNTNAILVSPEVAVVDETEHYCLEFNYHMLAKPNVGINAPSIGSLGVKIRNSQGQLETSWKRQGSQSDQWLFGKVEFKAKPPGFIIAFEAIITDWKHGDIALDNIKFKKGFCRDDMSKKTDQAFGEWSRWTSWTKCDCTKSSPVKLRTRHCRMATKFIKPNCPGFDMEKQACECEPNKKMNFNLSYNKNISDLTEWSDWSECSVNCGNGVRMRSRQCNIQRDVFCRSTTELIREQTACSGDCSMLNFWSEWSDWSKCSKACGTGFMIRKRTCTSTKCTGDAYETKICSGLKCSATILAFKASTSGVKIVKKAKVFEWSDWSKWSECNTKYQCGKGVRTRKRSCFSEGKTANSFECTGAAFEMAECHLRQCEPDSWSDWSSWKATSIGYVRRNRRCISGLDSKVGFDCTGPKFEIRKCFHSECILDVQTTTPVATANSKEGKDHWSDWADCSVSCGNGYKTRTRDCYAGELNCHGYHTEFMTCTSYDQCTKQNYFMVCSFDKEEYCPMTGTKNWQHSSVHNDLSIPKAFGTFMYISNSASNARVAKIRTPIISDRNDSGQCLFFNYFAQEKSKFEVTKVTGNNSREVLFQHTQAVEPSNKWMMSLITIRSHEDFAIEFKGSTSSYSESLIAVDNIVFHPIEFCQILTCSFDDNNCRENLFFYQELQHQVWSVRNDPVKLSGKNTNRYLSADINYVPIGKKSFYGLPIVNPLQPRMCIKFFYLINSFADLRMILVRERIDLKQLWFQTSFKNTLWRKVLLEIEEVVPFQLIFEVYKKADLTASEQMIVGFDGLEISYGSCDQTELRQLEEEDRKNNLRSFVPLSNYPLYRLKRSIENFKDSNPTTECGGVYDLRFGRTLVIESPGYPAPYPNNQECSYLIKAPTNFKVYVKLLELDVEGAGDFCNDYLELRYFSVSQPGPKFCGDLKRYRGKDLTFTSYQESILVVFSSDWAVTRRGFKLQANMAF